MELPFLQQLGRAVKRLQHRHHRVLDAALREAGTSLAQWDALRAIHNAPGASSHALAELTFMTDQSFGALAGRLERQRLIVRSPGKGRLMEHRLTPAGEAAVTLGTSAAERALAVSFAPLDTAQREQLLALLSLLLADRPAAHRAPHAIGWIVEPEA